MNSVKSIHISETFALDIMAKHDFSKLCEMLDSNVDENNLEPLLVLFFYGLTYANQEAFHPFKISMVRNPHHNEEDFELMTRPILTIHPKLFSVLKENITIPEICSKIQTLHLETLYSYDIEPLTVDFKLKPNKKTIDHYFLSFYLDRQSAEKAVNWVFKEVKMIKEKYHLESIVEYSNKESKKIKL
jgi:hypothetical protein